MRTQINERKWPNCCAENLFLTAIGRAPRPLPLREPCPQLGVAVRRGSPAAESAEQRCAMSTPPFLSTRWRGQALSFSHARTLLSC
jgi:hypothetical protein